MPHTDIFSLNTYPPSIVCNDKRRKNIILFRLLVVYTINVLVEFFCGKVNMDLTFECFSFDRIEKIEWLG